MLHPELAARECAAAWPRPEEHGLAVDSPFVRRRALDRLPAPLTGCQR